MHIGPRAWNFMMSKSRVVTALAIHAVFLCMPALASPAESEEASTVKFLAESYLHHRTSFPSLKVVFEWAEVFASSEEHAFKGEFLRREEPITCTLITSPERRRYEFRCGPEGEADFLKKFQQGSKGPQKELEEVRCMSWVVVDANGYSLRYSVSGHSANLHVPNGERDDGVRISPFDLDTMGSNGVSHPARYINSALEGRFRYKYLGALDTSMTDLTVEVTGERNQLHFSFDPAQSYLLSRVICTNRDSMNLLYEMRVLKAKKCPMERWIPVHAVKVVYPINEQPMRVYEMKVLDLDTEYKSQPSDWEIEIQSNEQISVSGEVQWTRTPKDHSERFDPDSFPDLHKRCIARGNEYVERRNLSTEASGHQHIMPPGKGGRSTRFKTGLLYISNIVALVIAGVLFYRWRERARIK